MERDHELTRTLRLLSDEDLAVLGQSATWTIATMERAQRPGLARWNRAVLAVIDDEGRRRRESSRSTLDADRELRRAARALTGRELFLLSREYQITIDDVEAHWGRSYIPFYTTLRHILRRQLSRRHESGR